MCVCVCVCLWWCVYVCVGPSLIACAPGERHHTPPRGSKGGPDPAGRAAGGVRGGPRRARPPRAHAHGLRQVRVPGTAAAEH